MNRKLQLKILRNGPDKTSQDELDCAAWLIRHGFADGNVMPNHQVSGNHALAVIWVGRTPSGDAKLSKLNVVNRLLSSSVITGIIVSVAAAIISFFILRPFQSEVQPKNSENKQQLSTQEDKK